MRKGGQDDGCRSLLPQKITNAQSSARSTTIGSRRESRPAKDDRNLHQETIDHQATEQSVTQNILRTLPDHGLHEIDQRTPSTFEDNGRMQPPANSGRSLSTRRRLGEDTIDQNSRSMILSSEISGPAPRASRIATPRKSKPQISKETVFATNTTINHQNKFQKPIVGTEDRSVLDCSRHLMDEQVVEKANISRKASASRPKIAVSRHARPSSQQVQKPSMSCSKGSSTSSSNMEPIVPKDRRPVFSTYQQHFTPRKGPKLPTASFLAPPLKKVSNEDSLSAQLACLQMDLAQLHMLHGSSDAVQTAWEKSAQASFRQKLQRLSKQESLLRDIERQRHACINYPAWKVWGEGSSNIEFTERIQIVSQNLHDIAMLLDVGGKYSHVIAQFESWFASTSRIRNARSSGSSVSEVDIDFIEGIGDGWKAEVIALERKLSAAMRDLRKLGQPAEGSSIAVVISLLRDATVSMLEELTSLRVIEHDLITLEARWIEQEAAKITSGTQDDALVAKLPSLRGIWHGDTSPTG